jgi:hypothetical protein
MVTLADGRVLVTGGTDMSNDTPLSSAELYDPATGQFTPTGSMGSAHEGGTFTLLQDGRVLAAGGVADNTLQVLATAETYDPSTGQWTDVGSLALPRVNHVAALRTDGTVLLVAGNLGLLGITATYAEVFDPSTNQFIPTLGTVSVSVPSAVGLLNGAVLISGGVDLVGAVTSAAELFH